MLCLIILPKCCKEKEPKGKQLFITVHTINNNICDADPLGKLLYNILLLIIHYFGSKSHSRSYER